MGLSRRVAFALLLAVVQEALILYLGDVPPATAALLSSIVIWGAIWVSIMVRYREVIL